MTSLHKPFFSKMGGKWEGGMKKISKNGWHHLWTALYSFFSFWSLGQTQKRFWNNAINFFRFRLSLSDDKKADLAAILDDLLRSYFLQWHLWQILWQIAWPSLVLLRDGLRVIISENSIFFLLSYSGSLLKDFHLLTDGDGGTTHSRI